MTRLVFLPLLLLLAVVPAGCARDGASAPAEGRPWGRTFLSTSVTEQGQPRPLVGSTRIELRFDTKGRLVVQAGCNHIAGDARLDDDKLVVEELSMTDMGCDPPRHEQDRWVTAFLGGRPAWRLEGAELVLEGGGTRIVLTDREVADPDRPLAGPRWTVDTLVSGQVAGSVPAGLLAYLSFGTDGTVTGFGGCNDLGGRYSVSGGSASGGSASGGEITFTDVGMTLKACPGEPSTFESAVTAALRGTVTFTIEADHLTLTHPDGKGLRLTAK
ncbi:META domain-containing protein [Dactylosporangium fulvum]|uniref:META domain-containing protein n=1 Tax=Dactylosporangium fulvum TaxID=53359 RepID=A0ABY5VST6_9ACTN|nr:META domain-containing protein [Dactylosporangium fulvum]UWP79543.1 META domain-containing protein [Dactylosporangium fulvum]